MNRLLVDKENGCHDCGRPDKVLMPYTTWHHKGPDHGYELRLCMACFKYRLNKFDRPHAMAMKREVKKPWKRRKRSKVVASAFDKVAKAVT